MQALISKTKFRQAPTIFTLFLQNIFPTPSVRGTDSWSSICRQFPTSGVNWFVLSNRPSSPPVCINRILLPSHFSGCSAISFSNPKAAFPLYTGSRTTPVVEAISLTNLSSSSVLIA
uniref:Uncharacterized protein n=1 Tax=Opuntia streptacantha TaxID=393608 RepID=A0A7C8ZE69_OPUST